MPQTTRQTREPAGLVASRPGADAGSSGRRQPRQNGEVRGFAASGAARSPRRKTSRQRSPSLSKADWGPLGKHPDLDAIVARQRLRLPLSGRLSVAAVNQAWKRCAAEHHPDRGGAHDTMQLVNGARDRLLGRGEA